MTMNPSTLVRGELVDLIKQELLGPRGGVDEEIVGSPRARYQVGALAPVTVDPERVALETDAQEADDPNTTGEAISDIDKGNLTQRGVPVDSYEDAGAADDEEDRDEGPKGALAHPSSMGLRFQVPRGCGDRKSVV